MKSVLILSISLLLVAQIFAQEKEDKVLIKRPIQLSFIYPISSNGLKAGKVSNNVSFNMLGGYNGGLQGVEFGGLYNVIRYDMHGLQFAGLANIVAGESRGAQFAGLLNITAKGNQALQAAGLMNISSKSSQGLQLGGLINVAAGEMKGAQIAGLVNVAGRLKGFQLGFLNIADTVEQGIPFGFLSIVRKGYFRAEALFTETLHGGLNIKIGVYRLYNIFSIAKSIDENQDLWGFGYGLGSHFPVKGRLGMNIDAISYQIFEDRIFRDTRLNLLNRVSMNVSYRLVSRLELFGGISMNVLVADRYNRQGEARESIAPWVLFERNYRNTQVQIYPGIQAGIRI